MFLNVIIAIKIFLNRENSNVFSDTLHQYVTLVLQTILQHPLTFIEMRQKYSLSDKYTVLNINFNMKQLIKTFLKKFKEIQCMSITFICFHKPV